MFERTETDKEIFEIYITGVQYLTLAALLKAASQDIKSRFAITRVFYDHDRDQFVATDGHALRVERLAWMDTVPPQNSFFLSKRDLMLSKAQILLKYGPLQDAKDIQDVLVPIEYFRYEEYPEHPYPNYAAALPTDAKRRPVEWIGLSPDLLAGIRSSFYVLPRAFRFQFHGELGACALYDAQEIESPRFLGLVMPCRVLGDTPEPMFELKEIERAAPKEATEPTAEDLGQQNLVDHAERGPVVDDEAEVAG